VTKNIRSSLRLYIINYAVFSLLHLLLETTKNLAKKKKPKQTNQSISQILFYFQDRQISEYKQNSAPKTMNVGVNVSYNTLMKSQWDTLQVARFCLSSALKLGKQVCYTNCSSASPYLF